ncbi:MAG: SPASM domain-containing protein [Clostridia bacterium]|nr:SPASM domain-containing protein [Clostridia bacterium]
MFEENDVNRALAKRIFLDRLDECIFFPKYFVVETINACNASCIMCPMSTREKRTVKSMDSMLFDKFADEVKLYADWIESVCLNKDNEPTLDNGLAGKIRKLKDAGIKHVTISTNAQLLTPVLIQSLIDSGLDDIKISLNALHKETYEKINKGLDYNKVISNTLELIRQKKQFKWKLAICLRMVVQDENQSEVEEWLDFWSEKLGTGDKAYALPKHSWGNQLFEENKDKMRLFEKKPCVSPFSTMLIDVEGRVCLCCIDHETKFFMGDFSKQSIKEIWTGENFNKVRLLHSSSKRNEISLCRGCDIWERKYVVSKA